MKLHLSYAPCLLSMEQTLADSPGELGGWDGAGRGVRRQRVVAFREEVPGGAGVWERMARGGTGV